MNLEYKREMPTARVVKEMYPVPEALAEVKAENDKRIQSIFLNESDKFLLVIGPCSADREDSVIEYIAKLRDVQDKVADKIVIVPRIYTNKPRTTGEGYKGMLHQPDPDKGEDLLAGIIAIRELHTRILRETGFSCADEMLYPSNYSYLSDLLSYVAVGARSVENQEHRIVASGIGIPAGMKNPTGGDLSVMMNAIAAAQSRQKFIYRGWEVRTQGNPLAHAILRGYMDRYGRSHPNYHYEDLCILQDLYAQDETLRNPSVIVDTNHSNSGKRYTEQVRIAKDVMHSRSLAPSVASLVKGLMIESYLEDGAQPIGGGTYGCSITDPCLGWEKSERLIFELAEMA